MDGWEVSTTEIMDTSLRVKRRHRSWPEALKREIVAASLVPGASVSVVARRYDVNTNLVFTWRKQFGAAPAAAPSPQLVPVVVTTDQPLAQTGAAASALSEGMIEIELPRGYRVRVGGGVKVASLRLVLDALERR
jgi:transposase